MPDMNTPTTADAERALGPLIRARRQHLKLTLAQVAERVDLSIGMLSQVERGLSTPTIRQLQGIATALGVRIGWFFQPDEKAGTAEADIVVRAGQRRKIDYRDLGMTDELPDLGGKLGLLMCTLSPGASNGAEPYTHEGDEAGLLLSGTLEIEVDGRVFVLRAGDSFGFQSTSPHRYRNRGDTDAVIVWALTPPSF
jgi:transcriptional regulator with XRE-family HTH domain